MIRFFHPLLALIANSTHQQLAEQIQFLKAENEILRSKLPKRINLTTAEREQLIKFGKPLGKAINTLISIVSPSTFARWLRGTGNGKKERKPIGRPRTPEEICELVLKIRRETGFGYTRILGELRKLGIKKITRQTVKNILKEHGFDSGPKPGEGTWAEFLKIHAATLWACDFLSVRSWTAGGLVDLYLLVFIHIDTRQVWISSSTAHPDSDWVTQQARNFLMDAGDIAELPTVLVRDQDYKFSGRFDAVFESESTSVKAIPYRSPNLNAHCERWVQSLKHECLNNFVILGQKHLDHLVREYVDYFHHQRAHQSLDNLPPVWHQPVEEVETISIGDVEVKKRLGGLLKSFERKAA